MHFKQKAILLFLLVTTTSIASFIVIPSNSLAQTILFQDNFDDGNANGWDVMGLPGWSVVNGEYGIHLEPGVSNTVPSDNLWNENWNQYMLQVDLRGVSGTDKNLVFHFIDNSNFYSLHHTGGNLYFSKYINNSEYRFADPIHYPLQNGASYRFKIIVDGDHFKILENDLTLFDVHDSFGPKIQGGKIGLRVGTGAISPTEVWFDNVVVKSLEPPLPSLHVPDLKQYDPPWNDDIYDHASSWSLTPTLERWGCALTSASMVLKYYGHSSANPDTLNDWLKTQTDGYLRNGLLNWLAVSRYTRLNDSLESPTLLYRRLVPNNANLINELTQGRPVILGEPSHFVVAKSQLSDSFGINDPAHSDRTTLSSYQNTYSVIGSYQPTHTNLSYILLAIDPNINLVVFDTSENEISGFTFLEEPLIDDVTGTGISGNSLKVFLFPLPPEGNYNVAVSGSTNSYTLDSYLYNQDGKVTQSSIMGLITEGQTDKFLISIGETQGTNQEITIDSIIEDWAAARNQNLIVSRHLYKTVRLQLLTAKRLMDRGRLSIAKKMLVIVSRQIKHRTPKLIDTLASHILQTNLQSLVNSL